MKAWWTAADLAGLPGLPGSDRRVRARAKRERWPSRPHEAQGGGKEYAFEALPATTRDELARRHLATLSAPSAAPRAKAAPNAAPLGGLTGKKLDRAQARLAVLAALREYKNAAQLGWRAAEHAFAAAYRTGDVSIDPEVRAALPTVSASSLFNWRTTSAKEGPAALAGRYRAERNGKIDSNPAVRDIVIATLSQHPHIGAHQVRDQLRARLVTGKALPSLRRLQAWIARFKEENPALFTLVTNPDAYKNRFRPAFGSASEQIVRANQLWEIDDTRADIGVVERVGGVTTTRRRVLIALVDVATRRMMTLLSDTACSAAVLALIRRAILVWGLPETVKTDNGANYISKHVKAAFEALQINHETCEYFSPEQKPHVERSIGTIEHDLFEQLPGYVGHNVAERQAIRARSAFNQRMGKPVEELFRVSLSAAQLQDACESWCESKYAFEPHRGLAGRTPTEMAAELGSTPSIDERQLDVMLAAPAGGGWRKVVKKGIALDGTHFIHAELVAFMGEDVQVKWDEADAGRVIVYSKDGAFICVAEAPERTGISRREVASVARAVRQKIDVAGRAEIARIKRQVRPERLGAEVLRHAVRENGGKVIDLQGTALESAALTAAAEAARALATPKVKAPTIQLTDEDRALAGEQLRAIEAEGEARRDANVVKLPTRGDDGKLQRPENVHDDVAWAAWLLDDAANGDAEDRAWLKKKMTSWEFRQALEISGVITAEGRAAG